MYRALYSEVLQNFVLLICCPQRVLGMFRLVLKECVCIHTHTHTHTQVANLV